MAKKPSNARLRSQKPRALAKKNLKLRRKKKNTEIVLDREAGLVFPDEAALWEHFAPMIESLEAEYLKIPDKFEGSPAMEELEQLDLETELEQTLEEPSEIWVDEKRFKEFPLFTFIRALDREQAFQVALCFVNSDDEPCFILLHFLTLDLEKVNSYRKGDLIYDRAFDEVGFAMLEGDALSDGDPYAMGLFISMLKLRSEKDIEFGKFKELGEMYREETIENADEIWKSVDSKGQPLVTFIKEFPDSDIKDLHYVVVTQQDGSSGVHSLLFSFPTVDVSLVDRYRHGENLQAEEVTQESSH
jgi:hypothetical protein